MRHYYAISDTFAGDYPREYTHGFANTKCVIAFDSYQEREAWLKETKLLTARKITRAKALKMLEPVRGDSHYDMEYRARYCGCEQDYVVIKGWNY